MMQRTLPETVLRVAREMGGYAARSEIGHDLLLEMLRMNRIYALWGASHKTQKNI
jgi:hypothetical protein